MQTARDVMRTEIMTIRPEATLADAVKLLLDNRISGLPVTDESGMLVGIISEFALLAVTYDASRCQQLVREHMSKHVISVTPDSPLKELADAFILHRIRRLPVTENGLLVGMVSRRELLRATMEAGMPICESKGAV